MSTNFYFRFENLDCEEDVPSVRLSNGDEIKYLVPDQYSYDCHIGKRYATTEEDGSTVMNFTWAVGPYGVYKKLVECCFHRYGDPNYLYAVDEYGKEYTAEEFRIMLDDCLIWRLHAIGEAFC
jgi:hypothetical protein